ncbi:MAG: hypothetical protein MI975_19785 [Cytophagales bacterium]|nr:hypothetical protein [Cytophagales bacterium]
MKKRNKYSDEEIQKAIGDPMSSLEKNELILLNEDAKLYENLFKNLEEEPAISISEDFAKTTIEIAHKRKHLKDIFRKISLHIAVAIPLIALSLTAIFSIGREFFWNIVEVFKGNLAYFLFGMAIFSLIQILDDKLIRSKLKQLEH